MSTEKTEIKWDMDTNVPFGELRVGRFHTPVVEPALGATIGYFLKPGWIAPLAGLISGWGAAIGYSVYKTHRDTPEKSGATGTSTTLVKGCSCSHDEPIKESAYVGRSPYSLHHANASRFKAAGELALLEDHMVNDPCPDCMNKHAMTASRLMSEAATLQEGEPGDIVGADLIEDIRRQLKPESDIALANRARDIRKAIQQKLKLSHTGHSAHPER